MYEYSSLIDKNESTLYNLDMFSLHEMKRIRSESEVIFSKLGCPFCQEALVLLEQLVEYAIIPSFEVYQLGYDFENQTLTELVREDGWVSGPFQRFCTKPQIYLFGEYIGGNWELHTSKYNLGDKHSGMVTLTLNGEQRTFHTPQKKNPFPF